MGGNNTEGRKILLLKSLVNKDYSSLTLNNHAAKDSRQSRFYFVVNQLKNCYPSELQDLSINLDTEVMVQSRSIIVV